MTEDTTNDAGHAVAEQPAAVCSDARQAVAFFLDGQRYALPIERVQEIQQIVAFSEVPGGGSGIIGMINLRGNVIPALDMRQMIGLARPEYTLDTPMIICRLDDHLIALVVDEVQDVLDLPAGCLQDAPRMHQLSSKMLGVARLADGLVYLLDIDLLVAGVDTGW